MDIEEIQLKKSILQGDIDELLEKFSKETNIPIHRLAIGIESTYITDSEFVSFSVITIQI